MGLIGLSLIIASVVYVIIRPPSWLPPALLSWLSSSRSSTVITDARRRDEKSLPPPQPPTIVEPPRDAAMSPPPPSPPVPTEPRDDEDMLSPPKKTVVVAQPPSIAVDEADKQPESPTTPKAAAVQQPQLPSPPPTFSLSTESMPPPPPPPITRPTPSTSSSMMPPPPPPRLSSAAAPPRPPTLHQFPAATSAQRARAPILPDRRRLGPRSTAASSSLAPPPTHTSAPTKPSRRQVITLEPGHSPLDWARLSGSPGADLRGVPAATPYLRVTPSMLRKQTGRRGTDAWMALGGKVYNVSPYAKFHPGGVPELMRGAARDATRLFAEVHPWVNYENMLTACLVGILVDEPESAGDGQPQSDMEAMD